MKLFKVKRKKISEGLNLVAVVTKDDSIVVAGTFEDDQTTEQVFNLLAALMKAHEGNLPKSYVTFNALCASWAPDKYSQLIKFNAPNKG